MPPEQPCLPYVYVSAQPVLSEFAVPAEIVSLCGFKLRAVTLFMTLLGSGLKANSSQGLGVVPADVFLFENFLDALALLWITCLSCGV